MEVFEKTERNKVVRGANRAVYDKEQVFDILDAGFVCHVGFNMGPQPFIIPTAYTREGETIYIHGSVKSRMIQQILSGDPVCVSVTHLDGLVLARSAFHHSVNYRSVLVYGTAEEITEPAEKSRILGLITEQMLEGRWSEVRQPSEKELEITAVVAIEIESASAKVRTGDPVDDKEDYELDVWAGVLPVIQQYGQPISDEKLTNGIETSNSARVAWEKSKE